MLTVGLPAEVEDRLAALASRTGKPPAEHALEAILDHLETRKMRMSRNSGWMA